MDFNWFLWPGSQDTLGSSRAPVSTLQDLLGEYQVTIKLNYCQVYRAWLLYFQCHYQFSCHCQLSLPYIPSAKLNCASTEKLWPPEPSSRKYNKKQVEPSFQSPSRMNHHNPNLRMSGVRLARVRQVDWASRAGRGKGGAGNLAGFDIFAFVFLFVFVFRTGNSADPI